MDIARIDDLHGRTEELTKLVGYLTYNKKFITVTGFQGIGKSKLAKSAALFLKERSKF